MRLSTKGRYALRLMLDLALQPEGTSISLKTIAQRQGISLKYLEQIVTPLSRNDLLRSSRGAQGGYALTMPPEQYSVGLILRTIEGSLAPVACLEEDGAACQRQQLCAAIEVYRRIDEAIDNVVDNITLKDLVELQHQKWGSCTPPSET